MSTTSLYRMLFAAAAAASWCMETAGAAAIARIEVVNGTDPAQPLLLKDAAALESSLGSFRGQKDNAAAREAIADAVLQHYQSAGWPVVDVAVDKQDHGLTKVRVEEGRYGRIAVAGGSDWMRRAAFADWSRLRGTPLTSDSISEHLAWLHRNPLHAGTAGFQPGTVTATADTTLTLQEARPFKVFGGYRNDGSPPLDRDRFYTGFELADAFGVPSWLNMEVTSAPDADEYSGASSALRVFLPSHHELRLGGYWTQAESTTALPGFESVSGLEAWSVSLRWVTPLPAWRGWQSDFECGADFFRLDSVVRALGIDVTGRADTLHLAAALRAIRHRGPWRSGFDVDVACSPGGMTDGADDGDHQALRNGASADYTMARVRAWSEKSLDGGWTASGRVSGQWTSDPVVPVQEFSPAGAYGVRGFPASSALGDSGVLGSVEIMTPLLPLPDSLTNLRLRAAAFVDAAYVHDEVTSDDDSLASAGAGLRMQWRDNFGMALDYGWRLSEPGGRLHLALRMEF